MPLTAGSENENDRDALPASSGRCSTPRRGRSHALRRRPIRLATLPRTMISAAWLPARCARQPLPVAQILPRLA